MFYCAIYCAAQLLAGLPLSTDEVSAEEQLMLLGMASTNEEAHKMVMIGQKERPPPQLYTGEPRAHECCLAYICLY